jgi:hypothetical protein
MDQLLSKFTNLGYEILGIFVPGLILILFLLFGWWCLGPLAAIWTFDFLPQAKVREVSGLLNLFNKEIRFGLLIAALVQAYFFGHLLHWVARSPKEFSTQQDSKDPQKRLSCRQKISLFFKDPPKNPSSWQRIALCLFLQIPRPQHSYDSSLEPLLEQSKLFLGLESTAKWSLFYPVAKSYVAANLQTSLITTYQNKYTLHRSLTAAAAIWFWFSVFGVAGALAMLFLSNSQPLWIPLFASIPASLLIVWGFSDSYQYNWKLWGNTVITEMYLLQKTRPK